MQIMHFQLLNVMACIDLQYLIKVILLPALEPAPYRPAWFAGLLNDGGRRVPVIDLAMYLQMPRSQSYSLETPILLCQLAEGRVGLIVDKVISITKTRIDEIQIDPSFKNSQSVFSGTILHEERLSQLLDLGNIMTTMEETS